MPLQLEYLHDYQVKFLLVRKSLITYCKECLREKWGEDFDEWLSSEAEIDFGHGYRYLFKKEFSKYMNSEIEAILWLAGKNVVFAIDTFKSFTEVFQSEDTEDDDTKDDDTEDAELNIILKFTEKFISKQLDDFENWCDDIRRVMCVVEKEYDNEFCDRE